MKNNFEIFARLIMKNFVQQIRKVVSLFSINDFDE